MAPVRLLVVLSILGLPFGGAGSAADPDITDPSDDVQVSGGQVHVPHPEVDLRAIWVESGPSVIVATFQVANLSHRLDADGILSYGLQFESAEYRFATIAAWADADWWIFSFHGTRHDGAEVSRLVAGAADPMTDTIRVDVPRSLITSDLNDATATSLLGIRTPAGNHAGGILWFRDHAPNDLNGPTIPV